MTSISNEIAIQVPAFVGLVPEPHVFITDEASSDLSARELLLDRAFGRTRFEKTVERLREGRMPGHRLALVAKDGEDLVGTLRLWHIRAGDVPALLLGPLAVDKAYRSKGLGRRLMAEALFRAHGQGHAAILLVGDAPYYEPFGFSRRYTLDLALPGPVDERRFLGLELLAGALRDARGPVVATGALDHDLGSNRSEVMNVIDSKSVERDRQISLRNLRELDCVGKPVSGFPHPALVLPGDLGARELRHAA